MLIDLSRPIHSGMKVWPGDSPVSIEKVQSVSKDGVDVSAVSMGTHSGTHIDTPSHVFEDGKTLDMYDPSIFIGPGKILRPSQTDDITPQQIKEINCGIVFFDTGYDHASRPIALTSQAADLLVKTGVKIVGFDSPSCESPSDTQLTIHKKLLAADILIIENLTNLDQITSEICEIIIAPLALAHTEAAPCRVFAKNG